MNSEREAINGSHSIVMAIIRTSISSKDWKKETPEELGAVEKLVPE
jgi:hypothetical protein